MLKIVGIDPGLAGTGVGVIKGSSNEILEYSYGSISTSPDDPVHLRLNTIYTKILEFLKDQQPDHVVIEDIYSLEKYPGSGIMLGKVSGVLLLAVFRAGLEAEEIPVRQVKQIISGNGRADKYQMERSVRNLLNHKSAIRPFHASDALGLALTGYYRHKKEI